MTAAVTIRTGARLHFGPLSYRPAHGPHFGGIGLMIDTPGFTMTAQPSSGDTDEVHGDPDTTSRLQQMLNTLREQQRGTTSAFTWDVKSAIPSHRGLGSGTQLALAVMAALERLHDPDASDGPPTRGDVIRWAQRTGRGHRSAVGLHGFRLGGFIVDAGKQTAEDIGRLACRVEFPTEWPIVLMTPRDDVGTHGDAERQSFDRLAPMPADTTAQLCRLVLMEMLPAINARDCARFGEALFQYGHVVGEFFSDVQGGPFAHPDAARLVELVRSAGMQGVVQSSWGPTLVAICPDPQTARQLHNCIAAEPGLSHVQIHITHARNATAHIHLSHTSDEAQSSVDQARRL